MKAKSAALVGLDGIRDSLHGRGRPPCLLGGCGHDFSSGPEFSSSGEDVGLELVTDLALWRVRIFPISFQPHILLSVLPVLPRILIVPPGILLLVAAHLFYALLHSITSRHRYLLGLPCLVQLVLLGASDAENGARVARLQFLVFIGVWPDARKFLPVAMVAHAAALCFV